jgi:hypothetical protein
VPFNDVLRKIPRRVTRKEQKLKNSGLKLAPFPNSLAATFAALPSLSLFPSARFADVTDAAEKKRTELIAPPVRVMDAIRG